jgi:predicted SAM-dependent methyltransferase
MLKRLVTPLRPLLVWAANRRFRRTLRDTPGPISIAVGAGGKVYDGWISSDIGWSKGNYLDVTRPWNLEVEVTRVFGDNMVEHLGLAGTRAFLRHAYDALVPGGSIRLVTPDVEAAARIYLNDPNETARLLVSLREHESQPAHEPVDLLHAVFHGWGHNIGYLFDYQTLAKELDAAGFVEIDRVPLTESLRGFPATDQVGREEAIHFAVEAERPS